MKETIDNQNIKEKEIKKKPSDSFSRLTSLKFQKRRRNKKD